MLIRPTKSNKREFIFLGITRNNETQTIHLSDSFEFKQQRSHDEVLEYVKQRLITGF